MALGPGLAGWGQTTWGTATAPLQIGGALFLVGIPLLVAFDRVSRRASTATGRPLAAPIQDEQRSMF
jgi:hypothetical protein